MAKPAQAARIIDQPQAGYFKMRLVKGGPYVAARIIYAPSPDPSAPKDAPPLDRPYWYAGVIDGRDRDGPLKQPGPDVMRIWTSGESISADEYELLLRQAEWDRNYAPNAPAAQPEKRIDFATAQIPF